ncbi:MAG TPA: hypoxanthine-guanine phosphoribosyltransferase [Burkholderiales bacterium]|nr:hypoxanthine-guanine phosphoribosyltransferase [Burkholderiales bacterium]
MSPDDVVRAQRVLRDAELLYDEQACADALRRLSREIEARLRETYPLVLCVMGGSVVFAGQLLPRLTFPLDFDYLHATRYDGTTRGGALCWKVLPRLSVRQRVVLVLDDILDEGHTMAAIRERLLNDGAEAVQCAVFTDKDIGSRKPIVPDYVGLKVPNRYVFGYGMDVEGAWRNLPAIYALRDR